MEKRRVIVVRTHRPIKERGKNENKKKQVIALIIIKRLLLDDLLGRREKNSTTKVGKQCRK